MDKNSIIGFVLIFFILIGFSYFQGKRNLENAQLEAAAAAEAAASKPKAETATVDSLAPARTADSLSKPAGIYADSLLNVSIDGKEELAILENDKFKVEFTSKGAQINSVQIKEFYNYDSTALYIFKPGGSRYSINVFAGEEISTSKFNFQLAEKTDTSIAFRLPFAGGGYIEQQYSIRKGSYSVDNRLRFVGMENVIPQNVSSFDIDYAVDIPRMEKGYKNESQYSKVDYYFEGDKKPSEMGKGKSDSKRIDSRLSWFAFQQQFFSAIMRAPQQFANGELSVNFVGENDESHNLMSCEAKMRVDFTPGGDVTVPFEFYFGPNSFQGLKEYDHKYEKIIPLGGWLVGWFTRYFIIPMFNFFHGFIDSYGLIILLMTIVIKLVVFPLTYKSFSSSAKMQALRPEIEKINAKYPHKDNQQEMLKKQQATMDLYRRAGASPMSGCLPMLLTLPILWAMFRFFPASIELRQQPFLWCEDLSAYDSILDYGTHIPILGDHLSLFALLMAVTMWLYSKMTMKSQPMADDPTAKSMQFMTLWFMPIMMFFICNSLSAALSYYYLLSQLISIIQTWAIRRSIKPEKVLAKVRESEGKPRQKSKWELRLEEARKMQEKQMRERQNRR